MVEFFDKIPKCKFGIWNLESSRILIFLMLFISFFGCNTENAPDCFQNAGDIIREEITVPDFTRIIVFENSGLVLKQGPETKVEVETGQFLRDEITAVVEDGRLVLRNENGCNFTREYGITKFYVTAPNILEIRSSTGLDIVSEGVLSYNNLVLISESFIDPEAEYTSGLFDLEIENQSVTIVSNGLSYYKLRGATNNFNVTLAAGDSRVEAKDLVAQNIRINHRASNDILITPQVVLRGEISGTGDVISYNTPATVNVQELYKGKLIFK